MRIVVVRLSAMGDVVLASAALAYLHSRYPQAQIRLVTDSLYAPLFQSDPAIAGTIAYDRRDPCAAARACRGEAWDLAVDLQGNRRSAALLDSVGVIGVRRTFRKRRLQRAVLLLLRLATYPAGDSVVRRYIETAGWDGRGEMTWRPRVVLDKGDERPEEVPSWMDGERPLLGLLPFSAWRNKAWPIGSYETVARRFIDKGWNVVVLGGPDDREPAEGLGVRLGVRCAALAGRVSLRESAWVLSRCRLAIGNDSGLTHLARAVGVRAAVVYGATTCHLGFFPFGPPPFRVLETRLVCRPCHAHGGNICLRGGRRACLTRVTPERAVEALEELGGERAA